MINLNNKKWKTFQIKNILPLPINGSDFPKRKRINGSIPLVGDSIVNNGVIDHISNKTPKAKIAVKNIISINAYGNPAVSYYHPYACYVYRDAQYIPLKNHNIYVGLFIATCIRQQRHQYDFGFQLNNNRLKNLKINLPINSDGHPDWKFMEIYIKYLCIQLKKSIDL